MKKEDIHLGDTLDCKVNEDMDCQFTGVVQKVYENSALLDITQYEDADKQNATELNFKIVINFKSIVKNEGGGRPNPEPESDEASEK